MFPLGILDVVTNMCNVPVPRIPRLKFDKVSETPRTVGKRLGISPPHLAKVKRVTRAFLKSFKSLVVDLFVVNPHVCVCCSPGPSPFFTVAIRYCTDRIGRASYVDPQVNPAPK